MTTDEALFEDDGTAETPRKRGRTSRYFAKWTRWLHIYLSMISFAVVLFFSATGITLNHPSWFGGDQEVVRESQGTLNLAWVSIAEDAEPGTSTVSRLEIVEHLRAKEQVRGAVGEFTIDEYQIIVTFRAPGYSADIFIDRETGQYDLVEVTLGFVAVLNDLHKGRDTGKTWSLLIDVSAFLMIFVSLTGFTLIFYIKRHRIPGLFLCLVGALLTALAYFVFVEH